MSRAHDIESKRRRLSLLVGVGYMIAGVLAGLNADSIWALYAPATAADSMRRTLSTLAVVFPHILVTTGFVLLIAGNRISRRWFVAIGLLPVAYAAVSLIVLSLI